MNDQGQLGQMARAVMKHVEAKKEEEVERPKPIDL